MGHADTCYCCFLFMEKSKMDAVLLVDHHYFTVVIIGWLDFFAAATKYFPYPYRSIGIITFLVDYSEAL